ncbi:MAG: MGMT family protein [Candidatus Paceibacterota bacterium]
MIKVMDFTQKVKKIVSQIPAGSTLTYKQVAVKAGYPRAYRAVGSILRRNTDYRTIPCHRVIKSDGRPGGYNRGSALKINLLAKEKVKLPTVLWSKTKKKIEPNN